MERSGNYSTGRKVGTVLAATSLALALEGCGYGSYEVPADMPLTILDKYTRTHFVTAEQSGGYPHYEDSYHFIVEQCDDVNPEIVQEDGCVDLTLRVSDDTYESYDVNDTIVYSQPRRAYPIGQ